MAQLDSNTVKSVLERLIHKLQLQDSCSREDKHVAISELREFYYENDPSKAKNPCDWTRNKIARETVPITVMNVITSNCDKYIKPEDVGYLIDAFWTLGNIWKHEFSTCKCQVFVCAANIIEECDYIELVNQCIKFLADTIDLTIDEGNFFDDSIEDVEIVRQRLKDQVYPKLLSMFAKVGDGSKLEILNFYSCVVVMGGVVSNSPHLSVMIQQAGSLLLLDNPDDLLQVSLKLISEISERMGSYPGTLVQVIQYTPQLSALLSHPNLDIRNDCLIILGNVIRRSRDSTDLKPGVRSSLVNQLVYVLHCGDVHDCATHALWVLGELAANGGQAFHCFFQYNFIPLIEHYISVQTRDIAVEAMLVLANICTDKFIENIYSKKCPLDYLRTIVKVLINTLNSLRSSSPKMICRYCLQSLKHLFMASSQLPEGEQKQQIMKIFRNSKIDECYKCLRNKMQNKFRYRSLLSTARTVLHKIYRIEILDIGIAVYNDLELYGESDDAETDCDW